MAVVRGGDVNVVHGLARGNGRGFSPATAGAVHRSGMAVSRQSRDSPSPHFHISTMPMAIGTDIRALVGNIV